MMYRKYHSQFKCNVLTIFAGELFVSTKKEIISTVLGSCISVCLYDISLGIGGMNHFMLPVDQSNPNNKLQSGGAIKKEDLSEKSMRYGITAMERLIAELQKAGADRKNIRAKVFGGGNVLKHSGRTQTVGEKNINFARAYLKMEQISIEKENVGANFGRKIFFLTENNSVFMKKVGIDALLSEEDKYLEKLIKIKKQGNVTLF